MNRRNFIKNSLVLCTCSILAYGLKKFCDFNFKESVNNNLNSDKKNLIEKYNNKSELPKKIRLEACSICQLSCPCCPRQLHPEKIKNACGHGYLAFENFKKIVDDNHFEEIELSNYGEIFLNPELSKIIKYAYEKNIKLTAYSGVNLNYLPDKMAESLVKYKFKHMVISIDGATPETYAIYRRGGDFNLVVNNIKKINYFKKKYNSKYPLMDYKFILFGHNENEIDLAKQKAKELGMTISFTQNFQPEYSPIKNIKMVKEKTGFDFNKTFDRYLYARQWYPCNDLWERPQINWDGKILGCCCNFFSDFGGNAFTDGLLNALNNPKMIYAKNMLINDTVPIKGIPCTECYYFPFIMNKLSKNT